MPESTSPADRGPYLAALELQAEIVERAVERDPLGRAGVAPREFGSHAGLGAEARVSPLNDRPD